MTVRVFFITCMIGLGMAHAPARAEDGVSIEDKRVAKLDMDQDGKLDWAMLADNEDGSVDLQIFMAVASGNSDLSRTPDVLKKGIEAGSFNWLESGGGGSLIVKSSCGGCSNEHVTSLTVVHHYGVFLVARYELDWETRNGIGSCEINFLTGKGRVTKGLDYEVIKRFKKETTRLKLANWSEEAIPKECGQ